MSERWEQAMAANAARRTAEAQQQIADARAEPSSVEIEAQMADAGLRRASGIAIEESGGVPRTRAGRLDGLVEAMKEVDRTYDEAVQELADRQPPMMPKLTITGAELVAYERLRAAAAAAHAAQQSMATTGAALREAIQGLCAAMTGDGK